MTAFVGGVSILPNRPFHPSAYGYRSRGLQTGFPTSTRGSIIHPWIPGISTPEGILLVTSVAMATTTGDLFVRLAHMMATGLVAATCIGVPIVISYVAHRI